MVYMFIIFFFLSGSVSASRRFGISSFLNISLSSRLSFVYRLELLRDGAIRNRENLVVLNREIR